MGSRVLVSSAQPRDLFAWRNVTAGRPFARVGTTTPRLTRRASWYVHSHFALYQPFTPQVLCSTSYQEVARIEYEDGWPVYQQMISEALGIRRECMVIWCVCTGRMYPTSCSQRTTGMWRRVQQQWWGADGSAFMVRCSKYIPLLGLITHATIWPTTRGW